MTPLVTIVIPTFRRPELVGDALRSALAQDTESPFDVLVIENPDVASPEGTTATEEVVRKTGDPRVTYRRNDSNLGMCGNWNAGLVQTDAEWVCILHDDDWLAPSFVRSALAASALFPAAVAVGGDRVLHRGDHPVSNEVFGATGRHPRARSVTHEDFLIGNPYPAMSCVLFRRKHALAAGGFDEDWFPSLDYAMWYRLSLVGDLVRIDAPLASYRVADNESMKPATIVRMALTDLRLHEILIGTRSAGRPLWRLYARRRCTTYAAWLSAFWGTQVDLDAVSEGARLTSPPLRAIARVIGGALARLLRRRIGRLPWRDIGI